MTGLQLSKLFAWVIGVLALLWLLAECLGGPDPTEGPSRQQIEEDAEQYVVDCRHTWEALEVMGEVDHENLSRVVDEIDMLASQIEDPELAEMTYSFGTRAEELVLNSDPEDSEELAEDYRFFRSLVEIDLSLRCGAATMSAG